MSKYKYYLGDGAYIDFDGYNYILTAENGIYATDTVYLEPSVLRNFLQYIERINALINENP